ncbi:hypothetical protein L209DRAFT_748885 [Thermothelomyces heterothallicus CBS 203.75]
MASPRPKSRKSITTSQCCWPLMLPQSRCAGNTQSRFEHSPSNCAFMEAISTTCLEENATRMLCLRTDCGGGVGPTTLRNGQLTLSYCRILGSRALFLLEFGLTVLVGQGYAFDLEMTVLR